LNERNLIFFFFFWFGLEISELIATTTADMKTLQEVSEPTVPEPEPQPAETGPGNVIVLDNNGTGADIISRVASIPMVSSTIGQVTNMYTWTKENSAIANTALGYAEKSVTVAAQTAKPVVDRLEKPSECQSKEPPIWIRTFLLGFKSSVRIRTRSLDLNLQSGFEAV
jgi:hypothetical protein